MDFVCDFIGEFGIEEDLCYFSMVTSYPMVRGGLLDLRIEVRILTSMGTSQPYGNDTMWNRDCSAYKVHLDIEGCNYIIIGLDKSNIDIPCRC